MVELGLKLGQSQAAGLIFDSLDCLEQPFVRNLLFWWKRRIQSQGLGSQGTYTFTYSANHNVKNTRDGP